MCMHVRAHINTYNHAFSKPRYDFFPFMQRSLGESVLDRTRGRRGGDQGVCSGPRIRTFCPLVWVCMCRMSAMADRKTRTRGRLARRSCTDGPASAAWQMDETWSVNE